MALLATLSSMSGLVKGIGPAFKGIGQVAKKMWADLKAFINDKFIKPLKDALQGIKDWWGGFKESVVEKWASIKAFVDDKFIQPLKDALQGIKDWWGGFKESVVEKWQGIKDFISEKVIKPIQEKWEGIKDFFGGLKDSAIEKWAGIKAYINSKVIKPIRDKLEKIKSWWGSLKSKAIEKVRGIWNYLKSKMSEIWDKLPATPKIFTLAYWKGLASDIGSALSGIGSSLVTGIKSAINVLIGVINTMLQSIDFSIDIPDWVPGIGGKSVGIDMSGLSIPTLAKGGIVNKPTLAVIGEDGPEAVVPLSQRNNPSGAGMGGGTYNITVNAGGITDRTDKRALAREIGNMIQQELARSVGGTTMRGRY